VVGVKEPIRVAVAQPLVLSHDVATNARQHAAAIRGAGARVIVFPELSLTGYELDAPAVDVEDARLHPIIEACSATGSIALVGAPVAGQGARYIAMLAVEDMAARIVYRKMWLGGDEPARFSPGSAPAVLEVDGWRFGLAICKDTRIAQHAADTAALGMDAYLGGITEAADQTNAPDERARRVAAAHHVWVAIASFTGATGGGFDATAGHSGIWSPTGEAVTQAGYEVGATVSATFQPRRAEEWA
jgi:predicted amidohydrolase